MKNNLQPSLQNVPSVIVPAYDSLWENTEYTVYSDFGLRLIKRNGRARYQYVCSGTQLPAFGGITFEHATHFKYGLAQVFDGRFMYHLTEAGTAAYRWRFMDIQSLGCGLKVMVSHQKCLGWSLFDIETGTFLTNPPRYRW